MNTEITEVPNYQFMSLNDGLNEFASYYDKLYEGVEFSEFNKIKFKRNYVKIYDSDFSADSELLGFPKLFTLKQVFGNNSRNSQTKQKRKAMIDRCQLVSFYARDYYLICDISQHCSEESNIHLSVEYNKLESLLSNPKAILNLSYKSYCLKNNIFGSESRIAWGLFFNKYIDVYYKKIYRELLNF